MFSKEDLMEEVNFFNKYFHEDDEMKGLRVELEKVGYGLKELVMTHHMEDEAGIEYALFVTNEKKVLLVS